MIKKHNGGIDGLMTFLQMGCCFLLLKEKGPFGNLEKKTKTKSNSTSSML